MATWRAASEAGKAALKVTTNLTGMNVSKNPHHVLGLYYSKTLRALAKMPSDYPYRKYTEEVIEIDFFSYIRVKRLKLCFWLRL